MLIGSKKTPLFAFLASSIKFTSGVITPAAAKPAQLRCFAIRRGLCRCPAITGPPGANLQGKCSPVFPLTIDV